jgi:hypothetical protein
MLRYYSYNIRDINFMTIQVRPQSCFLTSSSTGKEEVIRLFRRYYRWQGSGSQADVLQQ